MISLVIPVYNEKASLEELLRRVVAVDMPKELIVVDDCSTDGSREILLAPGRARPRRPARRPSEEREPPGGALPGAKPGEGSGPPPRIRGRHRRRGRRAGRRSGIRPARDSPAGAADPRRARRRRVRQPLRRRDAPRALLLARGGQLGAHHALQHDHGPEPDGHGDLLQGLPPRGDPVRSASRRTGSASSRRSPPRWRSAGAPGLRGARSATTAAPTRKARRSAGRTGSARSMRSRSIR